MDQLQQQNILSLLGTRKFTLILSNQAILTEDIESRYIGNENLSVNLNQFMYQASQSSVTFQELRGLSFLVLTNIGSWNKIINQNIPETKFLYQQQQETFSEITKYSDFPFFSTNLSDLNPTFEQLQNDEDNRVKIPITDNDAHMTIYGSYLKSQRQSLNNVLEKIIQNWPK